MPTIRTRRTPFTAFLAATLAVADCATPPPPATAPSAAAPPGDFKTLGRLDAPVVIVEYTDMQCPYCARFAHDTFPELKRRYIDAGKVRFESRDTPLPFHAYAVPAAIAARCAGAQGKFWPYREALFAKQAELASSPYDALAAQLGLDVTAFAACRADPHQVDAIRQDVAEAVRVGINATPSFLIGRNAAGEVAPERIEGAEPLAEFVGKIEPLLER